MLHGIDVSSHQSATPNLTGKQFIYVKATEGTSYVNPEQASQAAAGRAAGCVVGFYHFARAGNIQAQAKYFVDKCDSVAGDILVIDWEDPGVSCADKDALLKAVKALRPTHKVVLYCDTYRWLHVDTTSFCQDGLWIADYNHPAGQPGIQHPWLFHQYSDSPVDQDVANFATLAELKAWATSSQPTPAAPAPTAPTAPTSTVPQWRQLLDHVMAVPEKVYETWTSPGGWNNRTQFGKEYGWDGVAWCVIFDWDMYHDCKLDAVVPKTAAVNAFTSWAKTRGQWSEYPSVGAWVNFGNGAHTEIVVGFDSDTVFTKGGNSIKAGASDNGQGNGVWSHQHARRDSYVTGYFAPHFPDGYCPPTADPDDPRGGKAQTSYRWPGPVNPAKKPTPTPTPTPAPTVDLSKLIQAAKTDPGAKQGHTTYAAGVRLVEAALRAEGLLDKKYAGDGSFGKLTVAAYAKWQKRCGVGGPYDGIPGIASLTKLGKKHGFKVVA